MADMFHFNSPIYTNVGRRRRLGHNRTFKSTSRRRSSRTNRLHYGPQTATHEAVAVQSNDTTRITSAGHHDRTSTPFDCLPPPITGVTGGHGSGGISDGAFVTSSYPPARAAAMREHINHTTAYPEETNSPATNQSTLPTNNRSNESTMRRDDGRERPPNQHGVPFDIDHHVSATEAFHLLRSVYPTAHQALVSTATSAGTAWVDILGRGETLYLQRSQFRPNTPETIHSESNAVNSSQTHLMIDSTFNEEAWPVNDRRRTYDYKDFMITWRGHSAGEHFATHADPRSEQHLQQPRILDDVISSSSLTPDTDMQGLQWNNTYPSREEALLARQFLHPYRRTRVYPGYYKDSPVPAASAGGWYTFRNFVSIHRAMFSHYQLRNVLAASGRHDIFYAAKGKVWRTSLSCPILADAVLDFSKTPGRTEGFQITCLSAPTSDRVCHNAADRVLLAGGFNGEFVLLNTDNFHSHSPVEGAITNARNGLVTHIHQFESRLSGLPQASFCSNEGKVRLIDIRTLKFTDTFLYENPINCAATSSDRRLRALVGDMKDVFITDSEKGEILVTLQKHQDHGFACAWSGDGRYVATAAQDDMVVVWDARNWREPVMVQPTMMSCARSLQFTHGGTLVVAENEDIVSVYEGGVFTKNQDLQFFGSIAGVALINGGEEIVIANCDDSVGGLLTFETRTMSGSSYRQHKVKRPCRDSQDTYFDPIVWI